MIQQVESKRKQETMRFFNMLNEPERTLAINNYDETFHYTIPDKPYRALMWGFDWEKSPQGNDYWNSIDNELRRNTYNFKTEPMEQQSELDYQISVMQAKKEGKPIIKTKIWQGTVEQKTELMTNSESFNFVEYCYEVKPEPTQPKTVPFSFEDADFLLGLKIRNSLYTFMMITGVNEGGFYGNGIYCSYDSDKTKYIEYQDRVTLEWEPFVRVIK